MIVSAFPTRLQKKIKPPSVRKPNDFQNDAHLTSLLGIATYINIESTMKTFILQMVLCIAIYIGILHTDTILPTYFTNKEDLLKCKLH